MEPDPFDAKSLKKEINNFLWQYLPDYCTFSEAEGIAVDLFGRMAEVWEKKGATK